MCIFNNEWADAFAFIALTVALVTAGQYFLGPFPPTSFALHELRVIQFDASRVHYLGPTNLRGGHAPQKPTAECHFARGEDAQYDAVDVVCNLHNTSIILDPLIRCNIAGDYQPKRWVRLEDVTTKVHPARCELSYARLSNAV